MLANMWVHESFKIGRIWEGGAIGENLIFVFSHGWGIQDSGGSCRQGCLTTHELTYLWKVHLFETELAEQAKSRKCYHDTKLWDSKKIVLFDFFTPKFVAPSPELYIFINDTLEFHVCNLKI